MRETVNEYFKEMATEQKAFRTLGALVDYLKAIIGSNVEGALKNNAASVILAHNHPGGIAELSENDD